MRRERVQLLLENAALYAIILVIAPAGCGKSTAVHDFIEQRNEAVYIRLTSDISLEQFISIFATAMGVQYPDLLLNHKPESTKSDPRPGLLEHYIAWATLHLKHERRLIVIDDVHHADGHQSVATLLVRLADTTKDYTQWLFSSRTIGKLPTTRWLAYGDAATVIGAKDLLVTSDEASALLEMFGSPLDDIGLEDWRRQTNGFIVPLTYALRLSARRGTTAGIIDGTRAVTFSFLAEELWQSLTADEKELLEIAAFMPATDLKVYARSSIRSAANIISSLAASIAFLSLNDDGMFSMHDLFRDFILHQVVRLPEFNQRQSSAIALLAASGLVNQAYRLLTKTGNVQSLMEFAELHRPTALDPAIANEIVDLISAIEMRKLPTPLLSLKTENSAMHGDSQSKHLANELYTRHDACPNDILCAIRAASRIADSLSPTELQTWCDRISIPLTMEPEVAVQIRAYFAFLFALNPDNQKLVESILSELLSMVPSLKAEARANVYTAATTAYFLTGNNSLALKCAYDALEASEASGDMRDRARALNSLGLILLIKCDAAIEDLFTPLRDAVESAGAWRYSTISHWVPAMHYAMAANHEAAKAALLLHRDVLVNDSYDRTRLAALSRRCDCMIKMLTGDYRGIASDYTSSPAPEHLDAAYPHHALAAISFVLLSDYESSENALKAARNARSALPIHVARQMQLSFFAEVIAMCAHGQWLAASRLNDQIQVDHSNIDTFRDALSSFCDGPPFVGLADKLAQCVNQPFVGWLVYMMQQITLFSTPSRNIALTSAELDVLKLIALGKSNKDIAASRNRSVETVKRQIATTYKKLSADNRVSALAVARERGLISEK